MTPGAFKSRRQALCLSQETLARLMGLSRSTLIRYEQGVTPVSAIASVLLAKMAAQALKHRNKEQREELIK